MHLSKIIDIYNQQIVNQYEKSNLSNFNIKISDLLFNENNDLILSGNIYKLKIDNNQLVIDNDFKKSTPKTSWTPICILRLNRKGMFPVNPLYTGPDTPILVLANTKNLKKDIYNELRKKIL